MSFRLPPALLLLLAVSFRIQLTSSSPDSSSGTSLVMNACVVLRCHLCNRRVDNKMVNHDVHRVKAATGDCGSDVLCHLGRLGHLLPFSPSPAVVLLGCRHSRSGIVVVATAGCREYTGVGWKINKVRWWGKCDGAARLADKAVCPARQRPASALSAVPICPLVSPAS